MQTIYDVRAVYHDGVLRLLDSVQLPDWTEVRLHVQLFSQEEAKTNTSSFVYPTCMVPAEKLDRLTGLVTVGSDALADSEALYDPDSTFQVRSLLVGQEFHHKGHEGLQGHKGKKRSALRALCVLCGKAFWLRLGRVRD